MGLSRITPERARELIDKGGITVLDVRTETEFSSGHLPGALLITDKDIPLKADELLPDKDAPLLVYCRSGKRSERAAMLLSAMGYKNVSDMGGIISWPYGGLEKK